MSNRVPGATLKSSLILRTSKSKPRLSGTYRFRESPSSDIETGERTRHRKLRNRSHGLSGMYRLRDHSQPRYRNRRTKPTGRINHRTGRNREIGEINSTEEMATKHLTRQVRHNRENFHGGVPGDQRPARRPQKAEDRAEATCVNSRLHGLNRSGSMGGKAPDTRGRGPDSPSRDRGHRSCTRLIRRLVWETSDGTQRASANPCRPTRWVNDSSTEHGTLSDRSERRWPISPQMS